MIDEGMKVRVWVKTPGKFPKKKKPEETLKQILKCINCRKGLRHKRWEKTIPKFAGGIVVEILRETLGDFSRRHVSYIPEHFLRKKCEKFKKKFQENFLKKAGSNW